MKDLFSKSTQKNLFLALCFTILFWSSSAWSHSLEETYDKSERVFQEKIYVTPEQIEVTEDGVLFYDTVEEMLILCKTLSYDSKGLYLKPTVPQRGPCGIHTPRCNFCSGCRVLYCPMKCKCDGN